MWRFADIHSRKAGAEPRCKCCQYRSKNGLCISGQTVVSTKTPVLSKASYDRVEPSHWLAWRCILSNTLQTSLPTTFCSMLRNDQNEPRCDLCCFAIDEENPNYRHVSYSYVFVSWPAKEASYIQTCCATAMCTCLGRRVTSPPDPDTYVGCRAPAVVA